MGTEQAEIELSLLNKWSQLGSDLLIFYNLIFRFYDIFSSFLFIIIIIIYIIFYLYILNFIIC